jgi:RNA polymerase sigma-70 factor (sigma-E family)
MRAATAISADEDFAALFDESFETMKRLAWLLGADDPENIAQESFVRLHARWHTLAGPDKALPYLRRTVINLSRSRLRHLRVVRRAPREQVLDEASAEAHVLARAEHRSLRAALETLTERQRRVLVLRYWLDLDQAEIAETLGVAVGTVKATTSQALAKLRKIWPDEEADA